MQKLRNKRLGTPEQLNINIMAPMGATSPDAVQDQGVIGVGNFSLESIPNVRRNTTPAVQHPDGTMNEVRLGSNNDLDEIESVDSSNSSADLSAHSESHDFFMVIMPLIRPVKEPETDDVELYEKDAKKASKGKKKGASTKALTGGKR